MGDALARATAVLLVAALASCSATRALIPLLRRRAILDHPNERSSHRLPTPRGGGIAVLGAVLAVWLALGGAALVPTGVVGICLAAACLAGICWIDDLNAVSPIVRLLAQSTAVAIGLLILVPRLDGWIAAPALFGIGVAWVWWINLFNFMDGIDGIAGSEAAAIGAGLLLFTTIGVGTDAALASLAAAIAGAAIGFLVWNWSPARIFLGDVGSAPLGYLLGFLLLAVAFAGHWKIALILPLYFLADATITLVRRLLRGERVWLPHREHFYQVAVQRGFSHAAVTRRVIAADILLIVCGWAAENGWARPALALSAVTVMVLLAVLAHGR